ncbi:protein of unknown function [Candidatus Nitrosocosmicus franklandus]|uniref:Uncharacterized protein n=1 Tax=Candidatus Nitrosocosmicus franklandianus TaxID=1798806 RepID=A0A484I604_9ARCH|nr:protein of unknown function [Candidatus Nitrosocosmicus franklandus]
MELVWANTLLELVSGASPIAAVNKPVKITKPNRVPVFIDFYRSAKYKNIFYFIILENISIILVIDW